MTPEKRQAVLALVRAGEIVPAKAARLLGIPRWRLAALTRSLDVQPRVARWTHVRKKLAEALAKQSEFRQASA